MKEDAEETSIEMDGGEHMEEEKGKEIIKRVDFVLTFPNDDDNDIGGERNAFQDELKKKNLELFVVKRPETQPADYPSFLLIHIPFDVMEEYAEKLDIRKPLKNTAINAKSGATKNKNKTKTHFPMVYRQASMKQFDIPEDKESFFTSSERAQVIWHIMRRTNYGKDNEIGINFLLANGTFLDAYHLHDDFSKRDGDSKEGNNLKNDWASLRKWRQTQPLNEIRDYFGEEVALYFAWLGTYTKSLIIPALVGVCCFFYGLLQLNASEKKPMEEVCYGEIGEEMMCAHCSDASCSEEKLRSSCGTRILLLIFDNPATVVISIVMSFWAAGFLIYWKRVQTRLTWQWGGEAMLSAGGSDRDTWEIRPEYKKRKHHKKRDYKVHKEDSVPWWEKFMKILASVSVVLFMVATVVSALLGIITYSVSMRSALYFNQNEYIKNNSKTLTSFTAAVINLVIIVLLKWVYGHVAIWLTDLENPVTQADYDKSYIMKVYLFEFFNCYLSLFYIAFVKGHFYTYPGDPNMSTSSLAQDTCDSGGCLAELLIQLLVIMGGKQLLNLFMEMILPRIMKWTSKHKIVLGRTGKTIEHILTRKEWERDYHLLPENRIIFCQEILEIVIQYGFVTLFVAAFPLAPLFALINNTAEIRVDAVKMLTQYRRALPHRIKQLASWDSIQHAVTYLAVAVNGCIIAFTSEFIPRLVYITTVSEDHSLTGYINFSLAVYLKNTTSEFQGYNQATNHEICRYRGFREPPESENPYSLSPTYWHVLAVRLLFVIVFEHVVLGLSSFIAYYIPEVPRSVEVEAHKEREETKERAAET